MFIRVEDILRWTRRAPFDFKAFGLSFVCLDNIWDPPSSDKTIGRLLSKAVDWQSNSSSNRIDCESLLQHRVASGTIAMSLNAVFLVFMDFDIFRNVSLIHQG